MILPVLLTISFQGNSQVPTLGMALRLKLDIERYMTYPKGGK